MTSLSVLQNRMKREPGPYTDDFIRQLSHFEATRTLLLEQTTLQTNKETSAQFGKLAAFLAAVAACYPNDGGKKVPELIISLLETSVNTLSPDLRLKLLEALILLRVKGLMEPVRLMETCFGLFKVRDKPFRKALYGYIVKDVRVVNKLKTNVSLNRNLQSVVFKMLSDDERSAGTPAAAKRALSVIIELYKRRVWTDIRAVNVVADACFSRITRNAVAAARFFLGIDDEIDDLLARDEDDEDDGNPMNVVNKKQKLKTLRSTLSAPKVAKVTKKNKRKREQTKHALKRLEEGLSWVERADKQSSEIKRYIAPRFPAIDLINDPQTFVEKMFKMVRTSTERFEVRLIQMNLISRVVGHHKLLLFPFYSFCQRYLQPHQENVNSVLACVIQSSHDLVPPEEVEPLIRLLANNFINDRTGSEVMAVGLNAVRELIVRIPLLTEGDGMKDLISDLIAYRKYRRDRSVIIAARSLLYELRKTNPKVLAAKERGKFHNIENKPMEYGAEKVSEGVDGIELLEKWLQKEGRNSEMGDDNQIEEDFDEVDDDEEEMDDEEGEDEDFGEEVIEEEDASDFDEDISIDDDDDNKLIEEKDSQSVKTSNSKSAKLNSTGRLDANRILTDEDFKRIRMLKKLEEENKTKRIKEARQQDRARPTKQVKIMGYTIVPKDDVLEESESDLELNEEESEEEEEEEEPDPSVFNPTSLDGVKKKNRRELEEKLRAIQDKNEEKKLKHQTRIVNNTEKSKRTKDFHMVQKSRAVRSKQTLSIREQQAGLKKHMKSLQRRSKLLTKVRKRG